MRRIASLSVFSLWSFLPGTATADNFTVDDYLALKDVSEISISPEGKFVAYTLTSNDLEKDDTREVVWMQPTGGGEPLRMTAADVDSSSPKWSPDGRYLGILSDRKDDTSQVWLLDRRGGDAQMLTDLKQGVEAFEWAPDGKRILIVAEDPTPADLDEEERPNPRPYVVDRLQFKEDYVGYLDRHRAHIYVVDVPDGNARQLTQGDYDDSDPAWSPDGKSIVFVSNRSERPDRNRNTDLWIVGADGGELRQLTSATTSDANPSWSPDGRHIVYTSTVADAPPVYAIPQLTTIAVAGGAPQLIDALAETQVLTPAFDVGGDSLLAITEYRGEQNLVQVDIASGAVQSLLDGQHIVSEFSQSNDGALVALVSRPDLPDEIFAVSGTEVSQVSFVNQSELADTDFGKMEKHVYQSSDGTDIETFVTFPPGFKQRKQYPGLLMIHGGPQSQYDWRFDYEAQLLAAQGYVVVMPNPRGSYGYGQAFANAIYQDWGGIDFEDVIAAMDFAIGKGWVDAGRTGVLGWSYGGMMTNHVITKTDRFKAAITGASATLYMANYGHDQYQRWWEEELGLPWLAENREKWDRISPFFALDKVRTPTLIVGGEDDWNVPIMNSEQLYIALKRQGVETELVVYPEEGHSLSVPSYEKDLYERYIRWLERFVKSPPR